MPRGIYLDNATTTRPTMQVVSHMMPFFGEKWGTPTAPHRGAEELTSDLSNSYDMLYAAFGAREIDDFVFTSSGAEAINQLILSTYFDVTQHTGKNQFITSHIDEAPSIMAIGRLEKLDCVGKMVSPNANGQITAEILSEAITPRTALISLSWVNGLTGVINPIEEIAALCKDRGILFHVDITHAFGKLDFNFEALDIAFATFNGDHLHAPKGTGGLFIRAGIRCLPLILGGIEQAGLRAGSFNVPGFVALARGAKETLEAKDVMCTEVTRLRDALQDGLKARYPSAVAFFADQQRLPNCLAMAFPGVVNEALLYALNRKGVYASIGGGHFQKIDIILAACHQPPKSAECALNFTLSKDTTEEEIDRAIEIITEAANTLWKHSSQIEGVL